MKIDRKNEELIEACRKEITKLSRHQDAIYDQMADILGVVNDSLWDYCFNCREKDQRAEQLREDLYGD